MKSAIQRWLHRGDAQPNADKADHREAERQAAWLRGDHRERLQDELIAQDILIFKLTEALNATDAVLMQIREICATAHNANAETHEAAYLARQRRMASPGPVAHRPKK